MELDPYRILGVPYSANLKEIKEKFKKLVLKVHPDRGGNPKTFQIVKNAYKYLYEHKMKQIKQLEKERVTMEMLKEERRKQKKQLKRDFGNIQNVQKLSTNGKNFDKQKFNKLFNMFKTTDADDRGYEVEKSSQDRMDASDIVKKYGKQKSMQIAIIEEPEPIELSKQNYKQLGLKHVDDFSKKHSGGQGFTDLQKAYTQRDNLETSMGNVRQQTHLGRDVDTQLSRMRNERGNIKYQMNEEEQMKYNLRMKEEEAMEKQRQYRFYQQTMQSEKQFKRMQNYIDFR